jgi:hypothetical protein
VVKSWLTGLPHALKNPRTLACVLVLAIAAGGLQAAALRMKAYFRKQPVPLKAPFDRLDEARLSPYHVIEDGKLTLTPEELEQLNTQDYLQWVLRADPAQTSGPRYTGSYRVLVTYYTGQPDQVPHIPDRCQIAAGYSPAGSRRVVMELDCRGKKLKVPLRFSKFSKQTRLGSEVRVVVYTFYVNGEFEEERNRVRLRLGRLGERYAFYSKIEVTLLPTPDSDDTIVELTEAFLQKILPVLVEDHWPDWPVTKPG